MSRASYNHRRMDAAHAEAMARDDGEQADGGTALRSRDRARDARSLSAPQGKVLLMQLSVRQSAGGNRYLSGFLGRASVIAFEGEEDARGCPTWNVYVSTPAPRPDGQRQPTGGSRDADRG